MGNVGESVAELECDIEDDIGSQRAQLFLDESLTFLFSTKLKKVAAPRITAVMMIPMAI